MIADCLELLFYKSHLQSHDPDVAAIIFGFSVSELSQLRDYLKDGRHSFMHFFTDILSWTSLVLMRSESLGSDSHFLPG